MRRRGVPSPSSPAVRAQARPRPSPSGRVMVSSRGRWRGSRSTVSCPPRIGSGQPSPQRWSPRSAWRRWGRCGRRATSTRSSSRPCQPVSGAMRSCWCSTTPTSCPPRCWAALTSCCGSLRRDSTRSSSHDTSRYCRCTATGSPVGSPRYAASSSPSRGRRSASWPPTPVWPSTKATSTTCTARPTGGWPPCGWRCCCWSLQRTPSGRWPRSVASNP